MNALHYTWLHLLHSHFTALALDDMWTWLHMHLTTPNLHLTAQVYTWMHTHGLHLTALALDSIFTWLHLTCTCLHCICTWVHLHLTALTLDCTALYSTLLQLPAFALDYTCIWWHLSAPALDFTYTWLHLAGLYLDVAICCLQLISGALLRGWASEEEGGYTCFHLVKTNFYIWKWWWTYSVLSLKMLLWRSSWRPMKITNSTLP